MVVLVLAVVALAQVPTDAAVDPAETSAPPDVLPDVGDDDDDGDGDGDDGSDRHVAALPDPPPPAPNAHALAVQARQERTDQRALDGGIGAGVGAAAGIAVVGVGIALRLPVGDISGLGQLLFSLPGVGAGVGVVVALALDGVFDLGSVVEGVAAGCVSVGAFTVAATVAAVVLVLAAVITQTGCESPFAIVPAVASGVVVLIGSSMLAGAASVWVVDSWRPLDED